MFKEEFANQLGQDANLCNYLIGYNQDEDSNHKRTIQKKRKAKSDESSLIHNDSGEESFDLSEVD